MLSKYKVPILSFCSFLIIGVIVAIFRDIRYFMLFFGIGTIEFFVRLAVIKYPQRRQLLRLLVQAMVGGFLLFYLSLVIGVNFQYSEIFFDFTEGVVTGALIQTIVARLLLPLVLGNAFCSRACWTGLFFELTNTKRCKKPVKRNSAFAWAYLFFMTTLALVIAHKQTNPAADENLRHYFIIGENLYIIISGFILTFSLGSRAYCRLLCPFLSISGLLSPFSYFKVRIGKNGDCNSCMQCNNACPMMIDVNAYVKQNRAVDHRQCILCERCVSSCAKEVIKVNSKKNS